CAAAAAKGAALLLATGRKQDRVRVKLPGGQQLMVPLVQNEPLAGGAMAVVVKDGGDDPDSTHGLSIVAKVWWKPGTGIEVTGGPGVGLVTKPGLPVPPGEPAINPVPRRMILENVAEVLGDAGALVEISVPGGEAAAKKTMNPQLGITGGISILGTTGIVEPMSEERFKASLVGRVKQVKALGFSTIVMVPGRAGAKTAVERFAVPEDMVAQVSNFVGSMLEAAAAEGFQSILLLGHIGKLVKVAGGSFHTHNRVSDGRLETMAAWLGVLGAPPGFLREILGQPTTDGAVALIKSRGYEEVFSLLAGAGERKCRRYLRDAAVQVGIVLTGSQGELLGLGPAASMIGREIQWQIP
ncbi:MAG TPA: cobalamin biosynthesis protein CbiD, partial [Clostridia bacterium]|nr:cobalamin biosynthesis protein CbiD [Clostridia bacterium]